MMYRPAMPAIDVQPRDAQRVVMEPDGARLLLGRVGEGCLIGPDSQVSLSPAIASSGVHHASGPPS